VCGSADVRDVRLDTIDEYVHACIDFYTNTGIREQMRALRDGFARVFPIEKLQIFTPDELLVSGGAICMHTEYTHTRADANHWRAIGAELDAR
jgi:hypothetical protein